MTEENNVVSEKEFLDRKCIKEGGRIIPEQEIVIEDLNIAVKIPEMRLSKTGGGTPIIDSILNDPHLQEKVEETLDKLTRARMDKTINVFVSDVDDLLLEKMKKVINKIKLIKSNNNPDWLTDNVNHSLDIQAKIWKYLLVDNKYSAWKQYDHKTNIESLVDIFVAGIATEISMANEDNALQDNIFKVLTKSLQLGLQTPDLDDITSVEVLTAIIDVAAADCRFIPMHFGALMLVEKFTADDLFNAFFKIYGSD
jgi:hypothetical protein